MLSMETQHSGGKLHPLLDLCGGWGGEFLEENEGIGTEAAGTSQLQDWNVEHNSLESKWQNQEFEKRSCRRSQCLF